MATAKPDTTTTNEHTVVQTVLGDVTIVRNGEAIVGLYFPHHWHRPDPATFGPRTDEGFDDVVRELNEFLAGERREFTVPLKADGDEFQRRVWDLIADIPYGQTTSYGAIAKQVGEGADPREVGAAVGRNPLSILRPCHRVVGGTGKLTGYAGGLRRKQQLLDLERAETQPAQLTLL